MARHEGLMRHAIEAATRGIEAGQSPFGATIAAADGSVVVSAHNTVRADCDATAHAEIVAIRTACHKLGTIDLSGHVIATTCEPCPMCAAAIHWARLDAVVCGASIADARRFGFNELPVPIESLLGHGTGGADVHRDVLKDECVRLFDLWADGPNPDPY